MIVSDLIHFKAKRVRGVGKGIREYNGIKINITNKKVQIQCDDCRELFYGLLHNFFDTDKHLCRTCRIKGELNPRGMAGKKAWNKNLTKNTSEILKKQGEKHSKKMKGENNPWYGIYGSQHPLFGKNINVGKNNPSYKDGKSRDRVKSRRSLEYDRWAKQVKDRDDYTCQKCKEKGGKLTSHHLYSFSDNPEIRYCLDNGITLCKACHNEYHEWNGGIKKSCTKESYIIWISR